VAAALALMHRLRVVEPSIEECGGQVRVTRLDFGRSVRDEHRLWSGRLSDIEARRLTADRHGLNRRARRRLARIRKFRLERRRLLSERCISALLSWDRDADGCFSYDELNQLLSDLLPKAPPTREDLDALMSACSRLDAQPTTGAYGNGRIGRASRVYPTSADASRLTPHQALQALRRYDVAVADVATAISSVSRCEIIVQIAELSEFDELLEEERCEREGRAHAAGSPSLAGGFVAVEPQSAHAAKAGSNTARGTQGGAGCCTVQ
jgi:hypothetical protein